MATSDQTKLAREVVRAVLDFTDSEDVRVNGLDRRNRERLVRRLARLMPEPPAKQERVLATVKRGVVHCGACNGTTFKYSESHPSDRAMLSNKGRELVFWGDFQWYDGDDDPGVECDGCGAAANLPDDVEIDFRG